MDEWEKWKDKKFPIQHRANQSMAASASTLSPFSFASLSPTHGTSIKKQLGFHSLEKSFSFTCFFSKKKQLGFMDQILDYIEGGPKLRKWYGAPDIMSKDENALEEEDTPEEEVIRDAVLVTDGDNDIGQMIILSLIVKRVRVKTLVKDKRVSMEAFGTYVEPMTGDTKDKTFLKKALRGVRALICPNEGFLCNIESWKGVEHVILLSQLPLHRDRTGIQGAMNSNAKKLAEQDESVAKACGVPYTIIRTGDLKNTPGGKQGFSFEEGSAVKGTLSKEDAALICVEALDNIPQKGLIFEVVNGSESVSSWKNCFATLMNKSQE